MGWFDTLKSDYKRRQARTLRTKKDRKVKGSSIMDIRRERTQREKEEREQKKQREKELWEKENPIKECERCGQKKRIYGEKRAVCDECENELEEGGLQ